MHAVVFRNGRVDVEFDDLKEIQATDQRQAQGNDERRAGDQPTVDQDLFLAMVFKGNRLGHWDRSRT
jgi:hypothetical protein